MALLVEGCKCKIQEKSTLWEVQNFFKFSDPLSLSLGPIFNQNTRSATMCDGIKYPCNQCDYQATRKGSLTTHIYRLSMRVLSMLVKSVTFKLQAKET